MKESPWSAKAEVNELDKATDDVEIAQSGEAQEETSEAQEVHQGEALKEDADATAPAQWKAPVDVQTAQPDDEKDDPRGRVYGEADEDSHPADRSPETAEWSPE